MASKVKVPCPKCDGRGIIPQYFYNRKGICFLCWGAKYIMVKVPAGKTKEEYIKQLQAQHKPDFKKNPPKVAMPHKSNIKNPKYFPSSNSKVDIKAPEKPKAPEDLKKSNPAKYVADKIALLSSDDKYKAEDWRKLMAEVKAMPNYEGKKDDLFTIDDAIDLLLAKEANNIDKGKIRAELASLKGNVIALEDKLHELENDIVFTEKRSIEREVLAYKISVVEEMLKEAREIDAKNRKQELADKAFRLIKNKYASATTADEKVEAQKYAEKMENILVNDHGFSRAEAVEIHNKAKLEASGPVVEKPETPKGKDSRIGTVLKGKGSQPDITVTDVVGNFILGEFINTKTQEKMYTVFPDDRIDDWKKYQSEIKANVGGVYSRFLKKQIFNENPIGKLEDWVAKGASGFSTNTGTNTGTDTPEDDDEARKKRMEARAIREQVRDRENVLLNRPNAGSSDEWKEHLEWLKTLPDSWDGKAGEILSVENLIKDKMEREAREKKYAEERKKAEENRLALQAYLEKHNIDEDNTSIEKLENLLAGVKANVPDGEAKQAYIDFMEGEIKNRKKFAERDNLRDKVHAEHKKTIQERDNLAYADITDDFKDTPIGNKVKALVQAGVNNSEDVVAIGAVVSSELTKKRSEMVEKFNNSADGKKLAEARKTKEESYAIYLDMNKKLLAGDGNYAENSAKMREHIALYNESLKTIEKLEKKEKKIKVEAYHAVLSEIRPMGTDAINFDTGNSDDKVIKKIDGISKLFPSHWWAVSNKTGLNANLHRVNKSNGGRAWHSGNDALPQIMQSLDRTTGQYKYKASNTNSSINLFSSTDDSVTFHEMMHRMEHVNKKIHKMEDDFYLRVTDNGELKQIPGHRKSEKYAPKISGMDWYQPYCGKSYSRMHQVAMDMDNNYDEHRRTFEIMTMGVQAVVFEDTWGNNHTLKEWDEEYYNFVLGMLAGV